MKALDVIKGLASVAGGMIVGGGVGVGVAVALMKYEQWRYPQDPSAGSVGIAVMLTVPVGVLVGMIAGAFIGDRWIKRG